MLRISQDRIDQHERDYPGFRRLVEGWEAKELPSCPHCTSTDTAEVSAGLVGRSMRLAGATTKIKLLPNGHPADYFCNECKRYFDWPDGPGTGSTSAPGGITMAGKDVVKAMETPEGERAIYEEIAMALGLTLITDDVDEREVDPGQS